MSATITKQDCGTNIAIFVDGNEQEIQDKFFSFWNHGATKSELKMLTDNKGYFWTTKKKLKKALTNAHLFRMLNDADELYTVDPEAWEHSCKGITGGFLPQARLNAQEEFDSYEKEKRANFNRWNKKNHSDDTFTVESGDINSNYTAGATLGSVKAEYTSEDAHKCLNQKHRHEKRLTNGC